MPCKCCTPAPVKHKQYVHDVCYGTRFAQRDGRLAEWNRSADAWHHGGRDACLRAVQSKLFYTISLANEANEVTGGYGTMNTGALITPDLTTEEAAKVVPYEPLLFVGENRADWSAALIGSTRREGSAWLEFQLLRSTCEGNGTDCCPGRRGG
jgi:hypothetical protein